MSTAPLPADPVDVVRQLDADAIGARLDRIEAERRALLVLLRAARRAGKRSPAAPPAPAPEVAHAQR